MQIQHLVTILNRLPSLTRSFRLIHWNTQRTVDITAPGNLLMPLPKFLRAQNALICSRPPSVCESEFRG